MLVRFAQKIVGHGELCKLRDGLQALYLLIDCFFFTSSLILTEGEKALTCV